MGVADFMEDGVDLSEDLVDGHGVHLAAVVITGLDGFLEVAAGGLSGEGVGDDVAGALFVLDPGETGHGDPDGALIDVEADIHRVGVAGGDSDNVGFPASVKVFAGPAVGGVEIFVHNILSVEHFPPRRILGWMEGEKRA